MAGFDPKKYLSEPKEDEGFDPNSYAQGDSNEGFDPEKYIADSNKPQEFSETESALLGGAQGLSFGFADEAEAAARAGYKRLTGESDDLGKAYEAERSGVRGRYERAQKENPKSYLAGEVTGSVAPALIPGVGAAKAAGTLAKFGRAAVTGGMQAAGTSEADLLKGAEGAKDLAKDVGVGAIFGLGAQKLGDKASRLPGYLKGLAEERAVKVATGQNKKAVKEIFKGGVNKAGRHLLTKDAGGDPVVKLLSSTKSISPKLAEKQLKLGAEIGKVADEIDAVVPKSISGKELADEIRAMTADIPALPQTKAAMNRMLDTADAIESAGNLSFKDAQKFKNQFKISSVDPSQEVNLKKASGDMYGAFKRKMESVADAIGKNHPDQKVKDLLGKYKDLKSRYGTYKILSKAAKDREAADLANRFVSPSDYGSGLTTALGAAAMGKPAMTAAVVGLGAAGANKMLRTYGSSVVAKSADAAANILNTAPEMLGKYAPILKRAIDQGGGRFALVHQLLMQRDPEYKKIVTGGADEGN